MKNIKPLTFPFNSENNTSIKQSLFRFREYFDSSTIVGLGENAHFIKEFFTFRHQVIEFLVTVFITIEQPKLIRNIRV